MADFSCPFCNSDKFYKNGFSRGKQRYKCFSCKRYTYSHYPIDCHVEKIKPKIKSKSPIRKARLLPSTIKNKPVIPFRFEDDLWDVRALREIEANERVITINFAQINSKWLKTIIIQAALLNIRGEPFNSTDLPETLSSNPNAHTLAIPDDHINTPIYGYCGLSLDQDCPHWKACYTCPSFVARQELLPDYIKVRDLLRDKQTKAEDKGETALIDQFKQQADSLDTVIASFERVA